MVEEEGPLARLGLELQDRDDEESEGDKGLDDSASEATIRPLKYSEEQLYQIYKTTLGLRAQMRFMQTFIDCGIENIGSISAREAADSWSKDIADMQEQIADRERAVARMSHRLQVSDVAWPFPPSVPVVIEIAESLQDYADAIKDAREKLQDLVDGEQTKSSISIACRIQFEVRAARRALRLIHDTADDQGLLGQLLPKDMSRPEVELALLDEVEAADRNLLDARTAFDEEHHARCEEDGENGPRRRRPYLEHLRGQLTTMRSTFYQARMLYESNSDEPMPFHSCQPETDSSSAEEAVSNTSSCGDYAESLHQVDYIESLPGLSDRPKEPTFDRWKHSLGPFADSYIPPPHGECELVAGDCSDSISIRNQDITAEAVPTSQADLRRWRKISGIARANVAHLPEQYLEGVSQMFELSIIEEGSGAECRREGRPGVPSLCAHQ